MVVVVVLGGNRLIAGLTCDCGGERCGSVVVVVVFGGGLVLHCVRMREYNDQDERVVNVSCS